MAARLSRWFLLALPIAGVAELSAHFGLANRPPAFEEWEAVREPVGRIAGSAAPVIVAPRWAEPMVRRALGDGRMPLAHVARPDVDRFESAVEVSILGERSAELAGWTEEARETHGKLVLRRLKNPHYRQVIYDFVDNARPPFAEVSTTEPQGTCTYNARAQTMSGGLAGNPTFAAQRFECPQGVFFHVGVTVIADKDFRPRRCLWSHPPKNGEIVTRYRDVTLGDTIEGHGGISWMIERERRGAPVILSVRVDGAEIGRVTHTDGEGFSRFELPLGEHAKKAHANVEFGVSSPNHLHRHFCFEATSR